MTIERKPEPAPGELVEDVRRRLALAGWLASASGSVVVFISVGFLIPVFAEDKPNLGALAILNGSFLVAYVVVAGLTIRHFSGQHLRRTLEWMTARRAPDEREHRRTLALATYGAKFSGIAWVLGGILFSLLNGITQSWELAAMSIAAIWLGGETTCAITYLASERILRPVTARALAARPADARMAPGVRARLVMAWLLGTGVPLLGLVIVGVVGMLNSGVKAEHVAEAVIFLGVVASVVGMLTTVVAAKAIAHPVTSVRQGLEKIERGEMDVRVPVDDASEVGLLQAGFNRMAEGLRERERIRDLFGRQVGEDVARAALRGGTRLGGEEREIGALFVDVVGSTSMALAMPPTEVVRLLNRFFRVVVDVVEAEGALVNKFEGDAALCIFGAPVPCEDPACDALRAARALAARLSRELPEIDFGIGVSAGSAVAGNVGAERRFEYTVIGDPVNEASRLSELAKQRPERVLASDAALARTAAEEVSEWTVTDSAVLRGRHVPTAVAHPRIHALREA